MSTENENGQGQEQQQDAGKVEKQFNEVLVKIRSILGGDSDSLLHPKKKVKGDVFSEIVGELTKETVEKNRAEVKEELGTLLKKYVELQSEISKKEEELKKLKQTKQKEFTEAAKKFFNKIENVDDLAKKMVEALKEATSNSSETEVK